MAQHPKRQYPWIANNIKINIDKYVIDATYLEWSFVTHVFLMIEDSIPDRLAVLLMTFVSGHGSWIVLIWVNGTWSEGSLLLED